MSTKQDFVIVKNENGMANLYSRISLYDRQGALLNRDPYKKETARIMTREFFEKRYPEGLVK